MRRSLPAWGRRPNVDDAVAYLRETFPDEPHYIVEVGSLRTPGNTYGDGNVTYCWIEHINLWPYCGEVVSIDVAIVAVGNAMRAGATGICGDGMDELWALTSDPDYRIHLLYLDGSNDPSEALSQLLAAEDALVPGALVIVDDAKKKGRCVRDEARELGLTRFDLGDAWDMEAWIWRG